MSMQPSVQLRQALETGLGRLRTQHDSLNRYTRPPFNVWALGQVVITSDELEALIKSSQLFENEVDVLAQALPILRVILIPLRNLSIGVDPAHPKRPMIVAASPIIGI